MDRKSRKCVSFPLRAFVLSLCFCLPFSVNSSEYKRKPVIFNFGDSNSDTGGYTAAFGLMFGVPNGRTFFHHPTGRLGDGRLMIDFLCESLNMNYLSPFLQSLGSNFTHGANFAISGSCTLPRNKPFSLAIQVLQFLQFKDRSLQLISRGYKDLVSDEEFNNAVYTIDIGQNDISSSLLTLPYALVIEMIPSFVAEIRSSVWALYEHGGRNFWIHNTGPLGCLPQVLAMIGKNATDYDSVGCLESRNNAAKQFNERLFSLCQELRSQMKDATIVHVDMYSIKFSVITNPSIYGFEDPLMACCGLGGPPYNYVPNHACAVPGYNMCDEDGPKHISWDGVHYAEAANAVFASKILSTNYSTPPLKFDYFCT
ncbi:hypothetical protein UlMin_030812 [Ulmus minor]